MALNKRGFIENIHHQKDGSIHITLMCNLSGIQIEGEGATIEEAEANLDFDWLEARLDFHYLQYSARGLGHDGPPWYEQSREEQLANNFSHYNVVHWDASTGRMS